MVVGIPNVGKSYFINKLAGRSVTKTEDRPALPGAPVDTGGRQPGPDGHAWRARPKFEDEAVFSGWRQQAQSRKMSMILTL
jgi:ribosome biogenesis GTPase A